MQKTLKKELAVNKHAIKAQEYHCKIHLGGGSHSLGHTECTGR